LIFVLKTHPILKDPEVMPQMKISRGSDA